MKSYDGILCVDTETSIHNKGNPFNPNNFLVSYATIIHNQCSFKYYTDPDFRPFIEQQIAGCHVLTGFNIKFDIHWLRNLGTIVPSNVKIWDCQLAEFVYSGQSLQLKENSLDSACERYGLPRKPDRIREYWNAGISTEDIPIQELEEYNVHDVESTLEIFKIQQELLTDEQKRLVYLMGEDLKTLQSAEYAGIKVNVDEAMALVAEQSAKVAEIESELEQYLPAGIPPGSFNWNSGDHLSAFLYGGVVEFKYAKEVKTGVYKSGKKCGQEYEKTTWDSVQISFDKLFNPIEGSELAKSSNESSGNKYFSTAQDILLQLKAKESKNKCILGLLKARATEIKVAEMAESLIKKLTEYNWGEYIHGQFNQNIVVTGRLSSSNPNLQNQPPSIDQLLISRYA